MANSDMAAQDGRLGPHEDKTGQPPSSLHSPTNGGGKYEDDNRTRQQREAEEMDKLSMRHVKRNSFFLWMLGFINNFHYCLVLSAADAIATDYGFKRLVALISWCNVFFGIFVRIIAVLIATHVSYHVRIAITTACGLIGVLFVSFATPMGNHNNGASFAIMLIGVVLVGIESAYGESSILSFVQRYPASTVGAWSSGTGISGVIATLMYIGLQAANLSNEDIFLISIPFLLIYWLSFTFGLVAPHKVAHVTHPDGKVTRHTIPWGREEEFMERLQTRMSATGSQISSDYTIEMLMNIRGLSWHSFPHAVKQSEHEEMYDENGKEIDDLYYPICRFVCARCSRNSTLRRWWRANAKTLVLMHNSMIWLFFNLAAVYIAEYAAQFMAPYSFYCSYAMKNNFWIKNSYAISQLCYQLGVLASRSSLLCFKIRAVGVISLIQVANAVLWLIQAKTLFVSAKSHDHKQLGLTFLLFVWMIFVGLMGGASYVNVFYLVLERSDIMEQREADEAVKEYLIQEHKVLREPTNVTDEFVVGNSNVQLKRKEDQPSHTDEEVESEPVPQNDAEAKEVNEIRTKIHAIWQERREMGMNIGALYASVGITLGNVLDLIFTNALNLKDYSCGRFDSK